MQFPENALRKVTEAEYLTRENTLRYRGIVRVMYRAYEKMKYNLYRQDILEDLKQYDQFSDYDDERLKRDLDELVSCGNIYERADAQHAKTPEEYINKIFLYQLSPTTIEIERMLIHLENVSTGAQQKSSLESSYIEDFKAILQQADTLAIKEPKSCYEWWSVLDDSFKSFSENYKDYISDFYSPKMNDLLQTSEFLIFKEHFIIYLRNFIAGIQMNAGSVSILLETHGVERVQKIVQSAAAYANTIPQMNAPFNQEEFMELSLGKYETMCEWFLWQNGRPPLYEKLIYHTNEIIRKITRFALQILDKRNMSVNRKKDYSKILSIFSQCEDVAQAHKIAALAFGVSGTRHIICDPYRETDSIHSSVYDEQPKMVSIKPLTPHFKEKIIKTNIPDYAVEKESQRREILEKQKAHEAQIRHLITDNKIDLKTVPKLTTEQRMTILSWFSKKIKNEANVYAGETDFGAKYTIHQQDMAEEIKISCVDGDFYMPHFVIHFNSLQNES